jgi:NodT family efflux transporter outer membrane factor (OMF) lipoprotein
MGTEARQGRLPRALGASVAALLLAACTAGPDYVRPQVDVPVAWKTEAPWRASAPLDTADKGAWWTRFGDPALDALERQALANSPTLAAASARVVQARAGLAAAQAGLLPSVALSARAARGRISADRPLTNYQSPNFATVQNDLVAAFTASYELDLAGRVRRTIEGASASAQQAAADLENTRLLLGADLAAAYYGLRETDIELDVLARSIALQRSVLDLATARHDLGATSGLDVAQQQALLDGTLTQVDVLRKQREQFEHAIATLAGVPAPAFSLPTQVQTLAPPDVPIGVPSDVLERRPDVAAAERAMAAANAQIGVATAALYPSITLAPAYGLESRSLASLFDASSLLWSLGVSVLQPVIDSGRLAANIEFARGAYALAVANYRRIVLSAMQEAEDAITGLASLERASAQADAAIVSARRVLDLARARYEGGVATSLDVITAQQSLLASERLAAQLRGQRMLTAVFLVKALGGDWQGRGALAARPPTPGS